MNILLTNDDSIHNRGIWYACKELKKNNNVTVVAPQVEQSGIAHAFTLYAPLRFSPIEMEGKEGWSVNGTPSDCVKIGLTKILKKKNIL